MFPNRRRQTVEILPHEIRTDAQAKAERLVAAIVRMAPGVLSEVRRELAAGKPSRPGPAAGLGPRW